MFWEILVGKQCVVKGFGSGTLATSELNDFYLVGGTALALYYGHRLSVDLDLFSKTDFDTEAVIAAIGNAFPEFRYSRPGSVGLFGFIGDLKTDFVRHHH